eukprot:4879112-Alexandrium_andersonii.AAC.1
MRAPADRPGGPVGLCLLAAHRAGVAVRLGQPGGIQIGCRARGSLPLLAEPFQHVCGWLRETASWARAR